MTIKKVITESKGDALFGSAMPIYINRVSESFSLLQHTHDFVEICYVSEGAGFHYIADEIVAVSKGDLFFIPIGTSHVFRPASANLNHSLVVYNCVFHLEAMLVFSQTFPFENIASDMLHIGMGTGTETEKKPWFHYTEQRNEFALFFEKLHYEYTLQTAGYQFMLYTLLIQLLVLLYRYQHTAVNPLDPSPVLNNMDKAISYIQNHYNEPLTLTQMASLTGLSDRQFYRLFKKQTGQTFIQYVQNTRINQSCELLRGSTRKIVDIANYVGYQDLKFFYSLFKKKTGSTPRQYRFSKSATFYGK